MTIRVGTVLYGYCGGYFGRSFGNKRVEFIGADYVVVRDNDGLPQFEWFENESSMEQILAPYTEKPEDDEDD